MTTTNQSTDNAVERLQQIAAFIWYTLRSLKTLRLLLAVLGSVIILGFIIPQQIEPIPGIAAESGWIARLPAWLQGMGGVLFSLGFAQILQSFWFWLPAGLLLLHSFIALADYGPGSWRRARQALPTIEWQHPLAQRIERSVRLPDTPDAFLEARRQFLAQAGFTVKAMTESEQRIIGAARRHQHWLGSLIFYGGLIVIISAFFMSHFWLERDRLSLSTGQITPSSLLAGHLTLEKVEPDRGLIQVTYTPSTADQPPQNFTWRRFWPAILDGALLLPTTLDPILTIEVRDEAGNLVKLASPQAENFGSERLSIRLNRLDEPIYFSIPEDTLAFQIVPIPADQSLYNLQVLRGKEGALVEDVQIQAGQAAQIEDLKLTPKLDYEIKVMIGRDPVAPLYVFGLLLLITGSLITFLLPPTQIWLIPDIKGRGGQLHGVMEQQFGAEEKMNLFLEQVLGEETKTD